MSQGYAPRYAVIFGRCNMRASTARESNLLATETYRAKVPEHVGRVNRLMLLILLLSLTRHKYCHSSPSPIRVSCNLSNLQTCLDNPYHFQH